MKYQLQYKYVYPKDSKFGIRELDWTPSYVSKKTEWEDWEDKIRTLRALIAASMHEVMRFRLVDEDGNIIPEELLGL